MAYLVVRVDGKERGRQELQGPVVIGRAVDSDIFLDHAAVSRRHALVEPEEGGWVVVDLDSRNGVYIHKDKVRRHRLKNGEVFKVGPARITYHAGVVEPKYTERTPSRDTSKEDTLSGTGTYPDGRAMPRPIPRDIPEDAFVNPPTEQARRQVSDFPTPKPVPFTDAPTTSAVESIADEDPGQRPSDRIPLSPPGDDEPDPDL